MIKELPLNASSLSAPVQLPKPNEWDMMIAGKWTAAGDTPKQIAESHKDANADYTRATCRLVRDEPVAAKALAELRGLYEPFLNGLAAYFQFVLPPFQPDKPPVDNWQTSAWMRRSPGLAGLPAADREGEHFD